MGASQGENDMIGENRDDDDRFYPDYGDEGDGQPDEYTEYQDLYGGDDYDHGQFDAEEVW
jgi:hypothetical protein